MNPFTPRAVAVAATLVAGLGGLSASALAQAQAQAPAAPAAAASGAAQDPATVAQQQQQLPVVRVRGRSGAPVPLRTEAAAARAQLERVAGGTNLALPQEEGRLATLRDALDHQPGVVIQDFFGGPDQPRLNIRGSGIQSNPMNRGVLLLQDGLRLNEADGSFVIGLLEPRDAAWVGVRRGANAGHPGATTLGGELDFASLTAFDEQARLRLEAGSFGRRAAQVAAGTAGEQVDVRGFASVDRFDGYRHHSASRRDALRASLGFQGPGDFQNRTTLAWTDLSFQIPTVVPKARVSSDPRGIMGDGNTPQDKLLNVYLRDPRRATTQFRIANLSQWTLGGTQQQLGLLAQHTDDLFNNQTSITTTASRTLGAQWRMALESGAWSSHLAAAWSGSDMDRSLDATNPQTGRAAQRFGHYDLSAASLGLQAGTRWAFAPGWQALAELQWNRETRDARNLRSGTGAGAAGLDQQWSFATPKLGLIWTPAAGQRWFANLSRSHEAPTFWEIVSATVAPNNPAAASAELLKLKVQRATTAELGGQGRWGQGASATDWTLTAYRSEVRDELIATVDANGIARGATNYVGGTRHQGVEAGLSGAAGPLDYRAAWTFSHFRFKEGVYAGNTIAGVPRHLVSAELLYRAGGWRFGPQLRWKPGSTPTDHANTAASDQDAYALLGLKLDWRAGPWTVFLQADNLTDRRYASSYAIRDRATPDQPGYLPGLGRSFSAGLSYRLK